MSQPVTQRRATRSSATSTPDPASPSSPPKSRPKSSPRRKLLAADTEEEREGKQSIDVLPGRRVQARDLLRLLAPAPALLLLLYEGAATGKTRALLLALQHVRPRPRRVAYAALRSLPSARALFASLLSQLSPASALPSNSRERVPHKPSDFVAALRDALAGLSAQVEAVYLVFENLEVVRTWDKGPQLLSLLRLHDLLRFPQVVLVYVSNATPDGYSSMTGSIEPNHIYFPDYTVDEVRDILMRGHPNPKLYSSFLSVALKPLFLVTRRVDELAATLEPLFRKYYEPLGDLKGVPDEGMKRKLFEHIQPHLAAFLASQNPATLDAALFDSTGGSDNCKRKRKSSQSSVAMKDNLVEEIAYERPWYISS